eukprot:scaffold651_cov252-Pinguiococcus_pyrenoidosus.AAC.2
MARGLADKGLQLVDGERLYLGSQFGREHFARVLAKVRSSPQRDGRHRAGSLALGRRGVRFRRSQSTRRLSSRWHEGHHPIRDGLPASLWPRWWRAESASVRVFRNAGKRAPIRACHKRASGDGWGCQCSHFRKIGAGGLAAAGESWANGLKRRRRAANPRGRVAVTICPSGH